MDCATYLDLVAAHADGALAESEIGAADAHRAACPGCAKAFDQSSHVRGLVRRRSGVGKAPDSLRRRIEASTAPPEVAVLGRRAAPLNRIVIQGAIAALAVLAIGQIALRPSTPMQLVADDVHRVAHGEFEPVAGAPAPRTAPNLAALGWRVVGGREGVWGPMSGTMTVYESGDGATLVLHEMEAGPGFEMPPGGVPAGNRMEYFVDGVVVSVALEGSTVSCLAGRMPVDEFHRRVTG